MARPSPDIPPAAELRALVDCEGRLAVHVTPRARGESIAIAMGRVTVKVRARPQDGAANAAVERLVARALAIPTSRCRVVRGATSRAKQLLVEI